MHDEIIRYTLDGQISDKKLVQEKERMVLHLESMMREDGCVPLIDMEPQFTLDYKPDAEAYDFVLTIYGVYVGGSEAWRSAGVMAGTRIMRYTPQTKSKPSLKPAT